MAVFWKPGTTAPGVTVERASEAEDDVVINPQHAQFSLQQQRKLLPVFKHRTELLCVSFFCVFSVCCLKLRSSLFCRWGPLLICCVRCFFQLPGRTLSNHHRRWINRLRCVFFLFPLSKRGSHSSLCLCSLCSRMSARKNHTNTSVSLRGRLD